LQIESATGSLRAWCGRARCATTGTTTATRRSTATGMTTATRRSTATGMPATTAARMRAAAGMPASTATMLRCCAHGRKQSKTHHDRDDLARHARHGRNPSTVPCTLMNVP
jgi:NADH pyrophosphatase NudC (nudix superfamily)